jgi:hypothetical protein
MRINNKARPHLRDALIADALHFAQGPVVVQRNLRNEAGERRGTSRSANHPVSASCLTAALQALWPLTCSVQPRTMSTTLMVAPILKPIRTCGSASSFFRSSFRKACAEARAGRPASGRPSPQYYALPRLHAEPRYARAPRRP